MLGIPFVDYATYASVYRARTGTSPGHGRRRDLHPGGGGRVRTRAVAVGHMLGRGGAASWRGALYFFSASPHFAQLNSIAVLFEFEIDDNARNMEIKYYEWK